VTSARHTSARSRRPFRAAGAWLWRLSPALIAAPLIVLMLAVMSLVAGCTRTEWVDAPDNSARIGSAEYNVEEVSYRVGTIEYPAYLDGKIVEGAGEQAVTVRVDLGDDPVSSTVEGSAVITATMPLRLVGREIDLSSRDAEPDTRGLFYTFHLSQRGGGLYCRVLSWVTDPSDEPHDHFRGSFRLRRASSLTDEYIFEWRVTDPLNDGATVSEGFVGGVFARMK